MRGAELVASAISAQSVRTVFALGGASHHQLLDVLDGQGFTIVGHRHEAGVVGAADGYARVTGRPGVALLIPGPGLTNALNALFTARHACSPVVVLLARPSSAGDDPLSVDDPDSLEEVRSTLKWARTVHDASRLGEFTAVAFAAARLGRPGPALLSLPRPLLAEEVGSPRLSPPTDCYPPAPDGRAVSRLAELVSAAERPLLVAGAGARWSGAGDALRRLAGEHGLPVLGNGLGRGLVPEDLELGFPFPLAQIALADADLVLAIGARLSRKLGGTQPIRALTTGTLAQVDIDAGQHGAGGQLDMAVQADAALSASALASALEQRSSVSGAAGRAAGSGARRSASAPAWLTAALAPRLERFAALGLDPGAPIHPVSICRSLMALTPAGTIFVGDGADVVNWAHGVLRVAGTASWIDHQPFGSMGVGIPLAVGAAAGAREEAALSGVAPRPVVLLTGDGAFGFHPSELSSAVAAGLAFTTVISNDGAWGTERHGQLRSLGRAVNTELGQLAYERVGAAFGCHAERVELLGDLEPALSRALGCSRPAVVNVLTDPDAGRLRKEEPLLDLVPRAPIGAPLPPGG